PPTATPATPRPAPPDDMPELHTLCLEPRPINVWSIIRSALSRAWAVADRPEVTSEVVARLDAIAADCEREVLAALRSEAQGDAEALAAADMERVPTTKGER